MLTIVLVPVAIGMQAMIYAIQASVLICNFIWEVISPLLAKARDTFLFMVGFVFIKCTGWCKDMR